MGTLRDKTDRIQALAGWIAERLALTLTTLPVRACCLSVTCDQHGLRVHRHPGRYGDALRGHDGEAEDVAVALNEQYQPRLPVMTCRLTR